MMMPANFSVVAENEMTYVVGGGVIEAIGSVTAPIWTAANVKTFNTNLVTIIGNSYVSKLVGATLGVMFGGNWGGDGPMSSFFGDNGSLSGIVKYGHCWRLQGAERLQQVHAGCWSGRCCLSAGHQRDQEVCQGSQVPRHYRQDLIVL